MKKILLVLFIISGLFTAAQDEQVVQKQLKQISLLQLYIGYIQKGYDIAKKGLNLIGSIKDGNLQLDIGFFNSLKNVNPKVANYIKVAAIIDYQVNIVRECKALRLRAFKPGETGYVFEVTSLLLDNCSVLVDQLLVVTRNGELTMSDGERISQVDAIYEKVLDDYDFIRNFSREAGVLLLQRTKENNDIQVSKKINGL